MLSLSRVGAGYGGGQVLHEVGFEVPTGTVRAVVGRNGAGKTTLVHAIAGLVPVTSGTVRLDGAVLSGRPPHQVARLGVGLVPQGRRVFADLTVAEHLALAGGGGEWSVPRVLALFPRLAERLRHRGDQLSGGEQQMLAIARALLTQPSLLLLDEPCEGLAPNLAATIRSLVGQLAANGMTVLLVEQQIDSVIDVAASVAVLDHGRLVLDTDATRVRDGPRAITASGGAPASDPPVGGRRHT